MADEQYRWLDRETAESLLRGESLEAVDPGARDQAERLAKTLEGLTCEPPPGSVELPGEAAALAAFRAARSGVRTERSATGPQAAAPPFPDAGLVRIGGPGGSKRSSRRGRSTRFALTAVLAAGMVGGVAVAATSGVLPTPFGHDRPGPGASVSATASQPSPLVSPSPGGSLGEPTPDGSSGTPTTGPAIPPGPSGGAASSAPGADSRSGWWRGAPSACSDIREGNELGTGRRRALEDAAGSSDPRRVKKYCKRVLALTDGTSGRDKGEDRDGKGDDSGQGEQGGAGGEHGQGGDQGDQGGDDDGHGILPGAGGTGAAVSPSGAPFLPKQLIRTPTTSPSRAFGGL
ncbi:hypothetical protein ACIRPX_24820 [Streptomyces sp. NPDC101225]|uniref:hypothetical protein n=1 Tax=Streptomyces sp. NPDC101225 TaxID=3366135 RepID=UPI003800B4BD